MDDLARALRELANTSAIQAAALRHLADVFEAAGTPRTVDDWPPIAADTHNVGVTTMNTEPLELTREQADPKGGAACGCSLYTCCEAHFLARPRGCLCNGPYASSRCTQSTHRGKAAKWPSLDPTLVG